jgi:hypothetical protein
MRPKIPKQQMITNQSSYQPTFANYIWIDSSLETPVPQELTQDVLYQTGVNFLLRNMRKHKTGHDCIIPMDAKLAFILLTTPLACLQTLLSANFRRTLFYSSHALPINRTQLLL